MGQDKRSRIPRRITMDLQLREALCDHRQEKLEIVIIGQALYAVCKVCSSRIETPIKMIDLKVSISDSLITPIPDRREQVSHSREITKYDEELLKKLKISIPEKLPGK
jgi:hypothetical protein